MVPQRKVSTRSYSPPKKLIVSYRALALAAMFWFLGLGSGWIARGLYLEYQAARILLEIEQSK